MRHAACVICLAASLMAQDQKAEPEKLPSRLAVGVGLELRAIDADSLTRPLRVERLPDWGLILATCYPSLLKLPICGSALEEGRSAGCFFVEQPLPPLDIDKLQELARIQVDPSTWDGEGVRMSAVQHRMFVTHAPAALQKIAAMIDGLERELAPRYRVDVVIIDRRRLAAETIGALDGVRRLDRKAAGTLRRAASESGAVIHEGTAEVRPETLLHCGEARVETVVTDYDAKVVEGASQLEPATRAVTLGHGVSVFPMLHPTSDTISLLGVVTLRDRLPAAPLDTQAQAFRAFPQLDVSETQTAFSLTLADGDWVLYAPGGTQHDSIAVLLGARRLSPASQHDRRLRAYMVGLLASRALTQIAEADVPWHLATTRYGPEALQELIHSIDAPEWQAEGVSLEACYGALLVSAPKALHARVEQLLALLARNRARSFVVMLSEEVRKRGGSDSGWSQRGEPLCIPVLGDRIGYGIAGRSRNFVRGYSVALASGAALCDPEIDACFDGCIVGVAVEPRGEACAVRVHVASHAVHDLKRIEPSAAGLGATWSPQAGHAHLSRDLVLPPGRAQVLGSGPMRKLADGTELETRVRLTLREW